LDVRITVYRQVYFLAFGRIHIGGNIRRGIPPINQALERIQHVFCRLS